MHNALLLRPAAPTVREAVAPVVAVAVAVVVVAVVVAVAVVVVVATACASWGLAIVGAVCPTGAFPSRS
jgi:hypothetical protein